MNVIYKTKTENVGGFEPIADYFIISKRDNERDRKKKIHSNKELSSIDNGRFPLLFFIFYFFISFKRKNEQTYRHRFVTTDKLTRFRTLNISHSPPKMQNKKKTKKRNKQIKNKREKRNSTIIKFM